MTRLKSTSTFMAPHHLHSRQYLLFHHLLDLRLYLTFLLHRYTRSEIAKKGSKPRILEMHSQTTDSYKYSMFASQEGTYEVVSIEDSYCSYAAGKANSGRKR